MRAKKRQSAVERRDRAPAELGRVTRRWLAGASLGVTFAFAGSSAEAQMVGGVVTHGSATVHQSQTASGTHTQIDTASQHTRMRWDRHDIPVGDSVRVQQPHATSSYLAQVNDASVTRIDGTLSSNGQVWIANPAGVYFGGNAIVNVSNLVAAAGEISASDFLAGNQRATGLLGAVRNEGRIVADHGVSLMGRQVANHGQIVARQGDIVMAAGDEVWIRRLDTDIRVHLPATGGGPAVENTGELETGPRGRARLAAGDFLGLAIRNTGEIRAREIALRAGGEGSENVVEVRGTLDASSERAGQRGGRIEVEGDVVVVDEALLDASGPAGGGEILVGGEVAGVERPGGVAAARGTFVLANAELRADAEERGDGGSVVVWSEERTAVHGRVSATGGAGGGDGGFVETSSKGQLLTDADVDVSARAGSPGQWLLDPVNVYIVDDPADAGVPIVDTDVLTEVAVPGETVFDYLPDISDTSIPVNSWVSSESLEDAIVRGGSVLVTTETRFLTRTGDPTAGDIVVVDPIYLSNPDGLGTPPPGETDLQEQLVQPDTESSLFLLAANDVVVDAEIQNDNPNLLLTVGLEANDNELTTAEGQLEDPSQLDIGDVLINADILTNGGAIAARGVGISLAPGVTLDTTRRFPDTRDGSSDRNGGLINLAASNPVANSSRVPNVLIQGDVITDGGAFFASGTAFSLESTGSLQTFGVLPDDADAKLGLVSLNFLGDVAIDGDVQGETISMIAATRGAGQTADGTTTDGLLTVGVTPGNAVKLSASEITLASGDGIPSSDNQTLAQVVIGPDAEFVNSGTSTSDPTNDALAPDELRIIQDAPITDAQLPPRTQFGGDDIAGMRYGLESRDGSASQPDLEIVDSDKVLGADLAIVVPDTVSIANPIQPLNVSISTLSGWTVDSDLASRLQPTPSGGEGGILFLRSGLTGSGDLDFEDGVVLSAERIVLQAGDGDLVNTGDNGSGTTAQVLAENPNVSFEPVQSFEIRQDASILEANVPDRSQVSGGSIDELDYTLQSEGGTVTLSEADKVQGTDLTAQALLGIFFDAPAPIQLNSADLGGFSSFTVTEDLLDGFELSSSGARVLTLRAGPTGNLNFQSQRSESDGTATPLQLRVEADRIELIGASIDVRQGTPLFQQDDATSPERFIFVQGATIGDSALPTADNFPDGLGPSETFVVQSATSMSLTQDGNDTRNWLFPVQDGTPMEDGTEVILTAPAVNVSRPDGFNLVLGEYDRLWGTSVTVEAVFAGNPGDLQPIDAGRVDASGMPDGAIRGFDAAIDFTEDDFGLPRDSNQDPLPVGSFTVNQDNSLLLRTGRNWLPSFEDPNGMPGNLDLQPGSYGLASREGSIEVLNSQLRDTNLRLVLSDPEMQLDFERGAGNPLQVESLNAQVGGTFVFGDATDESQPLVVEAQESITLVSDTFGATPASGGDLRFAENVDLTARTFFLQAGVTGSDETVVLDARDNAPIFRLVGRGEIDFVQQGDLRNGLELDMVDLGSSDLSDTQLEDVTWGRLPDPMTQIVETTPETYLDRYRIESVQGTIEINDYTEISDANPRTLGIRAGNEQLFRTLAIRADTGPVGIGCATGALCGNGPQMNLDLIPDTSGIEAVQLTAATILLDAPVGFVDAGDPRIRFDVLGSQPRLAIRQGATIQTDQADRLPDRLQIVVGFDDTPYALQSLGLDPPSSGVRGINLGLDLANRVENSNLVLTAGLTDEEFEAAFGTTRGQPPVPDADPDEPDHVYERFADLNGDGVVDDTDRNLKDGDPLDPSDGLRAQVAIGDDANPDFELVLRTIDLRSTLGDDLPNVIGSVEIQTESDQIYRDSVQIDGDAVLTARAGILDQLAALFTAPASSIVFEGEVFGTTDGADSLVTQATNRVRFGSDVGTPVRLGSLTINLQQLIQLEDPPPIPRAEFGDGVTGGLFRVSADEVLLNPSAGDPNSVYFRREVPNAATFFRRVVDDGSAAPASLEFDLGSQGTFTMGLNEKLSVDGPELRISAPGGTATIGDLSALDLIDVDAATIHMVRRGKGRVTRANGRQSRDRGVDYVADDIFFHDQGTPHTSNTLYRNQTGGGRDARFGIADPSTAPAFMDNFSVLGLQFNILTGPGLDFLGSDLPIDGIPDGISRANLAESYPDARPDMPIGVPASYRVRDPDSLRDVGIALRVPTREELRSVAQGAGTIEDLDSLRRVAGNVSLRVAEMRLVASEIEHSVKLHDQVFAPDGSRAPKVREILQGAVDDYRRSTGARRIVGFELRRYVYNRPSSQFEAYQELQKLDSLFRHHRRSGLTPTEYRAVQAGWLESIQPSGITVPELAEFIHPSRYVRGSDVLDVFGD